MQQKNAVVSLEWMREAHPAIARAVALAQEEQMDAKNEVNPVPDEIESDNPDMEWMRKAHPAIARAVTLAIGRPPEEKVAVSPPAKAPRGVIAETASALGAGLASTAEAMGATAEMIGIPGGETVRKKMQALGESDMLRRPDYLEDGTVLEHPERLSDWRWWVRSLGENAPNMAAMMLPGVAAIRGVSALGWGAKALKVGKYAVDARKAAGLAGAWTGSMTIEAGSAYGQAKDEMTREGVFDADTIERIATLEGAAAGTANSLIELLPFDNLFLRQAGADRFLKRIVRQAFLEGSTESAQEAVNIYVEKLGHKPDQALSDNIGRMLESGIIGGALGGIAGGTIGTYEHRRNVQHYNALGEQLGVKDTIFALKDAGAPDKDIAAKLDAQINDLRTRLDETPPGADALTGGTEVKDVARKNTIPDVDAKEMVNYLLYGEGKYTPPPGLFEKATTRAKRGVLGMFGIKETIPPAVVERPMPSEATEDGMPDAATKDVLQAQATAGEALTAGPTATKDIAFAEGQAQAMEQKKALENRKKGQALFDGVIGELTQEDQARLEEARKQELLLKEQADQQAEAEQEAQNQAVIAQAAAEKAAVVSEAAGDHPEKKALVDQVMGLSDRVVLSSVQKELGLNVQPAGPNRYEIVTANGQPQQVPLLSLRKLLADKAVADYDARQAAMEKQRQDEIARETAWTEKIKAEKDAKVAAMALELARTTLGLGRPLSKEQSAILNAARGQLTPTEIARLDAGTPVISAPAPPRSLAALGVQGNRSAQEPPLNPPEAASNADIAGVASPPEAETMSDHITPEKIVDDETKVRALVLDELAGQIKDLPATGLVQDEDGESRRVAAGGWISRTVKTFGRQSTTPLRDDHGKPVTLGLSKAFLANVINKAREGKPLTEQQQTVHDVILREATAEDAYARRILAEESDALASFNPEEFGEEAEAPPANLDNPEEIVKPPEPESIVGETGDIDTSDSAANKAPKTSRGVAIAAGQKAAPEPAATSRGKSTITFSRGGAEPHTMEVTGTYVGDKFIAQDEATIAYAKPEKTYGVYQAGIQIKGGFDKASDAIEYAKQPEAAPTKPAVSQSLGLFGVQKKETIDTKVGSESGKQPWEMTYREVLAAVTPSTKEELQKARPILKELYEDRLDNPEDPWGLIRAVDKGDELPRTPTVDLSRRHKQSIQNAFARGENVPPAVLKDYPDLGKPAPVLEEAPPATPAVSQSLGLFGVQAKESAGAVPPTGNSRDLFLPAAVDRGDIDGFNGVGVQIGDAFIPDAVFKPLKDAGLLREDSMKPEPSQGVTAAVGKSAAKAVPEPEPEAKPAQQIGQKEADQMTLDEFVAFQRKNVERYKNMDKERARNILKKQHKDIVSSALIITKKPVPDKVLIEYPDIELQHLIDIAEEVPKTFDDEGNVLINAIGGEKYPRVFRNAIRDINSLLDEHPDLIPNVPEELHEYIDEDRVIKRFAEKTITPSVTAAKTGDVLSSDEFDALAEDALAEMAGSPASLKTPAPSQGVTAAVGKSAAAKVIGKNADGLDIYTEGPRRYIVENGVKQYESVKIVPTHDGLQTTIDEKNRPDSYLTDEERKSRAAELPEMLVKKEPDETALKKGDRVVLKNGRHGEISKVNTIVMRAIFGGAETVNRYYDIQTDAGRTDHAYNKTEITRETGPAPEAIPDIYVAGGFKEPGDVLSNVSHFKQQARNAEATAQRARKSENIRDAQSRAALSRKQATDYQTAFDAWAVKYPDEAKKYLPKKPTQTQGVVVATGQQQATIAAPTNAKSLADLGLAVTKSATNTGKTVWNVSGNTREHSDTIKRAGGRWYGPKKVWSFYNGDPSAQLQEALGISITPPAAQNEKQNVGEKSAMTKTVPRGLPELGYTKQEIEEIPWTELRTLEENQVTAEDYRAKNTASVVKTAPSLKTAASEVAKGVASSYDAIAEILKRAGKGPISMMGGGVFDEELYRAIKPHLQATYDHFRAAAIEVKEWMKETISQFAARGFEAQAILPYIKRFYMEVTQKDLTKSDAASTLNTKEGGLGHEKEQRIPRGESPSGTLGILEGAPGLDAGESSRPDAETLSGKNAESVSGPQSGAGLEEDLRANRPGQDDERGLGSGEPVHPVASERPGDTRQPAGAASGKTGSGNLGVGEESTGRSRPSNRNLAVNTRIDPDDVLFHSGKLARINANIRAVELSKQLIEKDRAATPAEQKTLLQFSGWGAVAQDVFNPDFDAYLQGHDKNPDNWRYRNSASYFSNTTKEEKYREWEEKYGRRLHPLLGGILTKEEWATAAASTMNAHYTSREVIDHGLWGAARHLGFKGGRVLEPAAGVGHILGLMPADFAGRVQLQGIELDQISGQILSQLYPNADIQVAGFEKASGIPDNSVDLVISNFPFGNYPINDNKHPAYSGWSVHNYFFARSIDALRPGGVVIAITSRYTMDSTKNGKTRELLADKADLVGAIRLPNNAFGKNAGTEVTTDIIILRKKTADAYSDRISWRTNASVKTKDGKDVQVNEYFAQHPEMVLGEHSLAGTMYGGKEEYTLAPDGSRPLTEQIDEAIARLPRDIFTAATNHVAVSAGEKADAGGKEGMLVLADGEISLVNQGVLVKPGWAGDRKKAVQAATYIPVRDLTTDLIATMQKESATAEDVALLQQRLNRAYDAYRQKYGAFNEPASDFLEDDVEFPVALALETEVKKPVDYVIRTGKNKGETRTRNQVAYVKSDIFTKRTLYPFVEPAAAENIEDAVNISLTYKNHISAEYIAKLLKKEKDATQAELLEKRLAFLNPANGLLESRSEYLSGNVREKLRIAEEQGLEGNAAALRDVQPPDLTIDEIYFRLGSEWIPDDVINGFMREIMGARATATFAHVKAGEDEISRWTVQDAENWRTDAPKYTVWGAEGKSGVELVEDCLNLQRTEIYDYVSDGDGHTKRVKNQGKSINAQQKQREIQNAFKEYVREHAVHAGAMAAVYNSKKNNYVVREYDIPDIEHYPHASFLIRLRDHQKRAVARGLQGSTIFAHAVGTGKTYMYASLAMELRRTGQARKPLIVVQGSTVNQFAGQAKKLYPAARILCPSKKDRTKSERRALLARIATNDYDMIIIPHSFFDDLNVNPAREKAFIEEQLEEIKAAILELDGDPYNPKRSDTPTVKQLHAMLKRKEARLDALKDSAHEIDTIYFDEMGIDAILVDEAHHYKRGDFSTKMGNVKGLDRGAAAKSFRFLMKARAIHEKTRGKNIYLATGTPVSNTTAELWTLLRYVRPDLLADYGAEHFDGFAATFGDTTRTLEQTETGEFKDIERFNRYVNGPELIKMWQTAADVILQEDVPGWADMIPKLKGDGIQSVAIPRSQDLADEIDSIREDRANWDTLPGKDKKALSYVPLLLFNRAKQAAIDLRLVRPDAADNPGSKTNRVVREVFNRWEESRDVLGTQLVFVDTYRGPNNFSLYDDIKKKLVGMGIPETQIANITENKYNTDAAKETLFEKVNQGAVRIVIGSTTKLGVGVNVQERLIALHHVDAPMRPMDFEQRNGRILRPGNTNSEVEVLAYAVINTLDSVTYDRLQKKQKFINQLLRGKLAGRSFEDPADELQFTFEDLMAVSAGNPLVKKRFELENNIREIAVLEDGYKRKIGNLRTQIKQAETRLASVKADLAEARKQEKDVATTFPDNQYKFTVHGTTYTDAKEGKKALQEEIKKAEARADAAYLRVITELRKREDNPANEDRLARSLRKDRDWTIPEGWKQQIDDIAEQIDAQINGKTLSVTVGVTQDAATQDVKKTSQLKDHSPVYGYQLDPQPGTYTDMSGAQHATIDTLASRRSLSGGLDGILTSIRHTLKEIGDRSKNLEARIVEQEKNLANMKAEIKKPFEFTDTLAGLKEQYARVLTELGATTAMPVGDETETDGEIRPDITLDMPRRLDEAGTDVEDTNPQYSVENVQQWPDDFPKIPVQTNGDKLVNHPDHDAAKSDDIAAAERLVRDLAKRDRMEEIGRRNPGAVIVPVIALERSGENRIPRAYAEALAAVTGLVAKYDIGQINKTWHTDAKGLYRLLTRAKFTGNVTPGQSYILVDDMATQGGTLAELRHYIENKGGKVVEITTLAADKGSTQIAITSETIAALEGKYDRDELEDILKQEDIAGNLEALTDSEGKSLLKYGTLDALRVRIDDAHRQGRWSARQYVLQEALRDQVSQSLDAPSIAAMVRQWAATMKGITIREADRGRLVIETKSGQNVEVAGVRQITPDAVSLSLAYGTKALPAGKVIAGQFLSARTTGKTAEIHLVRDHAGAWTMGHEFYHFLEDIGAISNEDKNLLNRKIRSLVERDPATYAKLKGMSPAEQRAEWIGRTMAGLYDATSPTGKIIRKIKDVIDQILNALGIRTAGAVVRDIRAGKIYDKTALKGLKTGEKSDAIRKAEEAYSVARKEEFASDAAYLKAVESGDMETAQRMVDEAAKRAGYNVGPVWHGSVETGLTTINPDFAVEVSGVSLFSDNEDVSYIFRFEREYGEVKTSYYDEESDEEIEIEPGDLIKGYLKLNNPFILAGYEAQQATNDTALQQKVVTQAINDGYDGIIFKDVSEGVGDWQEEGTTYGIFNGTQVKSADPVTYDDKGNVIPLSKRFNEATTDIRYALADKAEQAAAAATGTAAVAAHRALAMMGARTSPETREAARAFAKHWKEFWQPFSTVPDGDKILAKRYEAMGNVGRAVRFIEDLYKKMDAYPDQVKKDMFWYLNGDIPIENLPEEARETARMIQRRTEVIGEMLVDRGILAEGQFEKYRGKYIHYMYAKHVMGEDAPIFLTSTGKLNQSYTISRNPNLTLQQKKEMGLIEDASVAVPVGMGKALTDIAKYDYLQSVAENADWVWQPSLIQVPIGRPLDKPVRGRTRRNVTMGIGKLVEEAKTYDAMMAKHPTPEIEEIHRILHEALDAAEAASEKMPSDFVQLPNSKGYGPLAGAFVRKPIADDLMPVLDVATDRGRLMNTILNIERQGMAGFKMGKVALNFPTAVRNIISNIIQNNMRGRPLAKIPGDIIAACEAMKAKNAHYEEAFGMGLFHTNWFVSEVNNVLDEFRKVQGGRIDQILIAVKNVAKYYGKIDDINKLAIFIERRKAGKSIDEAALEAMKWGMDYSLTSRSIKGLRQTVMPFATYQYKIAPLIAESLKKRPWVLAKFGMIYTVAKAAAMSFNDLDDDDWEDLEKQLPAYIKKSGSMMILPWKSDKGQWQWVNLEYFFPWGNYLAIARDMKAADLGEGMRDIGLSNPFLSMFYTGLSAREDQPPLHSYFGTPIYNQLDPAPVKAAKLLEYMANIWMPSMATRQGAIGYTGRAIAGGEDRWGREVSAGQALGRWFGVNIVSVSPEQTRAQASVRIQDLRKEQSRIEANPSYDEAEKQAYAARLNEKLADIAEGAPAAVLPITKAKGQDSVYEALQAMAAKGILRTGPPSRSVEIAGVPFKMTMEQYRKYLDEASEIARRRLRPLMESPRWAEMSDRRKTEAVSGIVTNARKGIRQRIKREIQIANREKIIEQRVASR